MGLLQRTPSLKYFREAVSIDIYPTRSYLDASADPSATLSLSLDLMLNHDGTWIADTSIKYLRILATIFICFLSLLLLFSFSPAIIPYQKADGDSKFKGSLHIVQPFSQLLSYQL